MNSCYGCNICPPFGIKEGLVAYFDSNSDESWTPATGDTVYSLVSWDEATVPKLTLQDYGLAMIDAGKADSMFSSTLETDPYDTRLSLTRAMLSDSSGNTSYIGNIGQAVISLQGKDESVSLIEISGGAYFQNFFMLEGYGYQKFPYRFKEGFTLSNRIYNEALPTAKSYFLYLGARAENKFATEVCEEKFAYDSEGNSIGGDHPDFLEKSIYGNALGFYLDERGRIGYTYIDESGRIKDAKSCKAISLGFSNIDVVYHPYNDILDLDCSPRRKGLLKVYVNGLLFWDVPSFDEMWLKGMSAMINHQIGVPYNLSWGGGTDGLKYHWRYDRSQDYWLRDSIASDAEQFFKERPLAITSDYGIFMQYSGTTFQYTELSADFRCITKHPYLLKAGMLDLKADHIYRIAFEIQSLNSSIEFPDLDYDILASIDIELNAFGRDVEVIAELCEPLSYSGGTESDTWLYEKYFRIGKDCTSGNGQIAVSYDETLLPRISRFRVSKALVHEIFYNYKCRTEYCQEPITGTTIDCNDEVTEIAIDSEPCENLYKKDCRLEGLLLETIFSHHYEGMLNKLRVYGRTLSLSEIRANWVNDQMELGITNPTIGKDQSQPHTGTVPSRDCT